MALHTETPMLTVEFFGYFGQKQLSPDVWSWNRSIEVITLDSISEAPNFSYALKVFDEMPKRDKHIVCSSRKLKCVVKVKQRFQNDLIEFL